MDYVTRGRLPLWVTTIVIVFLASTPGVNARSYTDDIISSNYARALKKINRLDNGPRKLFLRGVIAFRKKEYRKARSHFEKLIADHPDHPRSVDASYYLDRIKLHEPTKQPPLIKVRLSEKETLTGSVSGRAAVLEKTGDTIVVLNSGQTWSVSRGYGGAQFATGEQSYAFDRSESLIIQPLNKQTDLLADGQPYRGSFRIDKNRDEFILINQLPLNHYLYGVVRKEIAPGWPRETVKAQSVAARSFAISQTKRENGDFDLKSSHFSQVYGGINAETKRVRQAVDATRGEVLTYANNVVAAYFHANSGGHIETASGVWENGNSPFIVPKPDTWSRQAQHSTWDASITKRHIRRKLSNSKHPEPAGNPAFQIESRLPSGRSKTISYRTGYNSRRTLRSNEFRMVIGPNKLKSTWIRTIEPSGARIVFKGRGWGHGIGLSQWGAERMGQAGFSYRQILSFYYQRAEIMDHYGLGTRSKEIVNE
ncbi:MAG: SpoIID/LytB domain-containing protein [bacterium]